MPRLGNTRRKLNLDARGSARHVDAAFRLAPGQRKQRQRSARAKCAGQKHSATKPAPAVLQRCKTNLGKHAKSLAAPVRDAGSGAFPRVMYGAMRANWLRQGSAVHLESAVYRGGFCRHEPGRCRVPDKSARRWAVGWSSPLHVPLCRAPVRRSSAGAMIARRHAALKLRDAPIALQTTSARDKRPLLHGPRPLRFRRHHHHP